MQTSSTIVAFPVTLPSKSLRRVRTSKTAPLVPGGDSEPANVIAFKIPAVKLTNSRMIELDAQIKAAKAKLDASDNEGKALSMKMKQMAEGGIKDREECMRLHKKDMQLHKESRRLLYEWLDLIEERHFGKTVKSTPPSARELELCAQIEALSAKKDAAVEKLMPILDRMGQIQKGGFKNGHEEYRRLDREGAPFSNDVIRLCKELSLVRDELDAERTAGKSGN